MTSSVKSFTSVGSTGELVAREVRLALQNAHDCITRLYGFPFIVIYPRGDLPVKVKSSGLPDPFYITCHLNPFHDLYKEKGLRSDDLVLER